jgi:hypothetical protein
MSKCFGCFWVFPDCFGSTVGECFPPLKGKHYLTGTFAFSGCFPKSPDHAEEQ